MMADACAKFSSKAYPAEPLEKSRGLLVSDTYFDLILLLTKLLWPEVVGLDDTIRL